MSKIIIEMDTNQLETIKKAMEHYVDTVQLEGDIQGEANMIDRMSEDVLKTQYSDTTYLWNC